MEAESIGRGRIEAFSDGVIAIIVTIMVLELKAPRDATLAALAPLAPMFLCYLLSFVVVAVMWVNHHHMVHGFVDVNACVLWLNINLLFWMSLIPFFTAWMGQHYRNPLPVALYGLDLALAASAFGLLRAELARQGRHSATLRAHHERLQRKTVSAACGYALAAGAAFLSVYAAEAVFAVIPLLYFVPERHPPSHRA
jgi:uncharacterized membrane protein